LILIQIRHSPEILDARPSALRPIAAVAAILLAAAVAVHDAEGDGRDDRYHKGHREEVDDHGHLVVVVVGREHHRLVLARVEAREDGALDAVVPVEVLARDRRRIAATLDVNQQGGLAGLLHVRRKVAVIGHVLGYRNVLLHECHIDVNAAIQIGGAALATRTPRAIEDTDEILATRRCAQRGLLDKVVAQRRYGRIDVERYEEEQRGAGGHREEGQCRGAIETRTFPPRTKAPIAIFLFRSQFSDFT